MKNTLALMTVILMAPLATLHAAADKPKLPNNSELRLYCALFSSFQEVHSSENLRSI